jgi:phosphate starvation-inducible protein PhoH and related proteins
MAKRKLQDATPDSFFGLTLTEEQEKMRYAIMNHPNNLITIVPSRSGSGKTTVALACAKLLVDTKGFDCLRYVFSTPFESRLGFRPGDLSNKEQVYVRPLFGALDTIRERPESAIEQMANVDYMKGGLPWIKAYSLNFIRGETYKNCVVWLDECQNATIDELRTFLSRIDDSCVSILTGDPKQIDIGVSRSGFQRCIDVYKDKEFATVCNLTKNFRGLVSSTAEEI